jgi:hypothetical protein
MADIFLSYKREDFARAKVIVEALKSSEVEGRKLTVWWDQDLSWGDKWAPEIYRELKASRCVIVLWSVLAVDSEWILMREAFEAMARGTLLPIYIDERGLIKDRLPNMFNGVQSGELAHWNGDLADPKFVTLVSMIGRNMKAAPERGRLLVRVLNCGMHCKLKVGEAMGGVFDALDLIARLFYGPGRGLLWRVPFAFLVPFVLACTALAIYGNYYEGQEHAIATPICIFLSIFFFVVSILLPRKVLRYRKSKKQKPTVPHDSSVTTN